ncbi:hypothetical protein LSTR_LSTR005787 [Laodelphax striatellus]|uniref:Actin-related protein 10 n=1 Tax=Laodelphax striatellus TaxID=195883 RepID=A0A482X052_LAOST|nr:hypothetical protein LSTR_LSTR005787 [Laodelphax striatellus]
MPLYEASYAEKHAVVLDLGIRYTKFGFAGEDSPRCIIPTEIADPETRQVRSIYSYKDETDLYSLLVEFIHMLHFKHLLVSPKDRRVLILESLLCPTVFRDVLAKVLFRHFEYTKIELLLNLGQYFAQDLIIRTCFVTPLERANKFADKSEDITAAPAVQYRVDGSKTITIPGHIRETCHEVFFERDSDQLSLPNMILDAIVKCNVDMRKQLAENIFLIGGSSMTPGFKYRLSQELNHLLKTPYYSNRLKINKFKFHTSRVKENYVGWLGGSLIGASDLLSVRSLTREGYLNNTTVPDWCNLIYNTKSISDSFKWTL